MTRKIFHDYINAFRWNRFRKLFQKGAAAYIFWMIYMMCLPLISQGERLIHMEKGNIWIYLLAVLYMVFVITNDSIVPVYLPKQMFLVPMSREERKKYMQGLMALKMLVPLLVGVFVITVWKAMRGAPVWIALFNYLSGSAIIVGGAITTWPGSIWFRNDMNNEKASLQRIKDKRLTGLQVLSTTEIVIGICGYLIGMIFLEQDDFEALWLKIVAGLMTGVIVILMLCILKYGKPVIEIATEYERSNTVDQLFRTEE